MKKRWISLIAAGALFSGALFTEKTDAASMHASHTVYVYNAKAKRVGRKKIFKGQVFKTFGLKKIKGKWYWRIGRNQYVKKANIATKHKKDSQIYKPVVTSDTDINLDTHSGTPDAKSAIANADQMPVGTKFNWSKDWGDNYIPKFKIGGNRYGVIKITFPDGSKTTADIKYTYHGTDHIKLPQDYTLSGLMLADKEPTDAMQDAAIDGEDMNKFVSESIQDDKEKVNMLNLTTDQKQRISNFALKLINEARTQLGRPKWTYDQTTQSLADDVATKYQQAGRGAQDSDHYVDGLVAAAAEHGYDIDGMNEIEDMYGNTMYGKAVPKPKTMTALKELVYNGVVRFLFNTKEFHHAADLMSAHWDSDWNNDIMNKPFAISFSRTKNWNSVHFISVPEHVRNRTKLVDTDYLLSDEGF